MGNWVMVDVRSSFLSAANDAVGLLGRSEVTTHWGRPSVLPEFFVSGLAGHLLRSMKTVELYLDVDEPEGEPLNAAGYYHALDIQTDINSPGNRDVRLRAEQTAEGGSASVAKETQLLMVRLETRLAREPSDRKLCVIRDLVITLDNYLCTRIVELVVHTDDLALSVGLTGEFIPSPSVASIAIGTLVDIACLRHGELGVLRALTRRERDTGDALRVL